jgi:hypothetical protein
MATVKRIFVRLKTGAVEGAGTNGHVFLGIGGREFNLNLPTGDREQGATDEYTLGEGANILNKDQNDPRKGCPVDMGHIWSFPVYVRFQGWDDNDSWNLESAGVEVFSSDPHDPSGATINWSRLVGPEFTLWLGSSYGSYCHLNATGALPAG